MKDLFKLDVRQSGKDIYNLIANTCAAQGSNYEMKANEETDPHDPKLVTFDVVLTDQVVRVRIEEIYGQNQV